MEKTPRVGEIKGYTSSERRERKKLTLLRSPLNLRAFLNALAMLVTLRVSNAEISPLKLVALERNPTKLFTLAVSHPKRGALNVAALGLPLLVRSPASLRFVVKAFSKDVTRLVSQNLMSPHSAMPALGSSM